MKKNVTHKAVSQGQKTGARQNVRTSAQARIQANKRIEKSFGDVFRNLAAR